MEDKEEEIKKLKSKNKKYIIIIILEIIVMIVVIFFGITYPIYQAYIRNNSASCSTDTALELYDSRLT